MHRCTILDDEIRETLENDNVILPSLQDAHQRHFPAHVDELDGEANKAIHNYSRAQIETEFNEENRDLVESNEYEVGAF